MSAGSRQLLAVRIACLVVLGAHLLVVAFSIGVLVDEWVTPSVDANIGYGLLLMLLGLLGLPWSLPGWWGFPESPHHPLLEIASIGGAVLNLAIHAGLWWRALRGVRRRTS